MSFNPCKDECICQRDEVWSDGYDAGFDAAMETIEDDIEVEVEDESYYETMSVGFEDGYQTALADVHTLLTLRSQNPEGCNCGDIEYLLNEVEEMMS
jgi:hypothetical protein